MTPGVEAISIAIPPGHCGLVLPRSGLALRHGVTVANAPGLIDAGYRGEVKVVLLNTDPERAYTVRLHFVEPNRLGTGKRVFHVDLQGKRLVRHRHPQQGRYTLVDEPDLGSPLGVAALPEARLDLSTLLA